MWCMHHVPHHRPLLTSQFTTNTSMKSYRKIFYFWILFISTMTENCSGNFWKCYTICQGWSVFGDSVFGREIYCSYKLLIVPISQLFWTIFTVWLIQTKLNRGHTYNPYILRHVQLRDPISFVYCMKKEWLQQQQKWHLHFMQR